MIVAHILALFPLYPGLTFNHLVITLHTGTKHAIESPEVSPFMHASFAHAETVAPMLVLLGIVDRCNHSHGPFSSLLVVPSRILF